MEIDTVVRADRTAYKAAYYRDNLAERKAYNSAYYYAHRLEAQERRNLRVAFMDAAQAGGCVDCGIKEQAVLEFDHVSGKKLSAVRHMVDASLPRLFEEIDKCETRCANCHRRMTAKRKTLSA